MAVVSLGFFLFIETKAAQPVLDLSLFKNRVFSLVCYAAVMHFMVAGSAPFLAPFFLIDGLEFSPSTVGILMALNALPAVFLAPAAGWLSDKRGTKVPMLLGLIFLWLCLFSYSRLGIESSVLNVLIPMLFYGLGMGLFFTSSNSAVVMSSPEQNTASVMGVLQTLRMLGQAIGVTVVGTFYANRISLRKGELIEQNIDPSIIDRLAVVDSFKLILFVLSMIFLSRILAVLLTGRQTKN